MKIVLALCLVVTVTGCAVAVEEPPYQTVVADGPFSVRDYPALAVAEVTVDGGQWQAANRGFRLLANYIFGGNQRRQSIAMTAPVTQVRGETIPMTAPVTQERSGAAWTVRFFMPTGSTPATLPQPNDASVRLAMLPPSRQAVLRFSGWALSGEVKAETGKLQRWMKSRALQPTGLVTLAQYDPPWTLWFLRRNEVMAPVEP